MAQRRESRRDAGAQPGRSRRPAYQHVAGTLRDAVSAGEFGGGRPLPTEAELGETFGVSRQTIRRAFRELVSEGLVYRIAGRGTFVTRTPEYGRYLRSVGTIEDLESWLGSEMKIVRSVELVQEPEMAERLDLETSVVATLSLLRLKEGVPFGLTRIYLSPELGAALTEAGLPHDRGRGTVIGMLRELDLTDVLEAEQAITAVPCPEPAADAIGILTGEPALKVERTYFDSRGRPVEVAVTIYNPARYDHRISIRRQSNP